MSGFSLFIPGEPKGKSRPRVTKYGTYTPSSTRSYEQFVKWCFKEKYAGVVPFEKDKPLIMLVIAYFKPPKRLMTKKYKMLLAEGSIYPTKKPDWDNIGKIIADSLNKVAYYDDAQIVKCIVVKRYATEQQQVGVKVMINSDVETKINEI